MIVLVVDGTYEVVGVRIDRWISMWGLFASNLASSLPFPPFVVILPETPR